MVKKASVSDDFDDALEDAPPVYAPTKKKEEPDPQLNGGGGVPPEVPPQEGTQVPTSQGTSGGTSEDDSLDFSLDGMLSEVIDPEVDWRKAGWSAKRYRKRAVEILVDLRWKGYRTEQELVDAALAAFIPDQVQDKARQKALRGEL